MAEDFQQPRILILSPSKEERQTDPPLPLQTTTSRSGCASTPNTRM